MGRTHMNVIALLLPLVLLVMVTPAIAWATNEGSYRYGYSSTFNAYKCVITDDCDMINSDPSNGCTHQNGVTNVTACSDGNVDGWKAWCKTDIKDCLGNVLNGYFPDKNHVLKPY
jgi:hypothetical protein